KVVGLEATAVTGGNGIGVEGIFAVGTELQKAVGIEISPVEVITTEMHEFQMLSDGALWYKFIRQSGENVAWLIEQGVKFSGNVDDYLGSGIVSGFHWFEGDVASVGYIPQMTARAEELGVDIRLETAGKSLITEDGKIVGLYAEDNSGNTIQINAKAVILACGGYAQNKDFMVERGWNWDNIVYGGTPHHDGDGLKMAFEAGARSFVRQSAYNTTNICGQGNTFLWKMDPFTAVFCGGGMFGMGGNQLWVNQDAMRFINEDFAKDNFEMQCVPAMTHRTMYSVFDSNILSIGLGNDAEAIDRANTIGEPDLAIADTVEDAAAHFSLDAKELQDSIDRYNELCGAGADADFGKPAELMIPIEQPPYYIAKLNQYYLMSVGGIECNINAQAVDETKQPIEGLYAVGTDGCMLYRNIYTINVGGTCNGNNINSGRTAANHAHSVIAGA
ncbi:MAG: FAD-binding protein, partial [Coriobacteriales bacterium]|nr:FAD-binding protein [Coriobacteriales bacterium]